MSEAIQLTQAEFRALKPQFLRDLQQFWEDETQSLDEAVGAEPAEPAGDLWRLVPAMDSKAVMKASVIVEKHLGIDLPPKLIRKGGYESFDAMVDHLIPQLEVLCSAPPIQAAVH